MLQRLQKINYYRNHFIRLLYPNFEFCKRLSKYFGNVFKGTKIKVLIYKSPKQQVTMLILI